MTINCLEPPVDKEKLKAAPICRFRIKIKIKQSNFLGIFDLQELFLQQLEARNCNRNSNPNPNPSPNPNPRNPSQQNFDAGWSGGGRKSGAGTSLGCGKKKLFIFLLNFQI